jgi:hypothetical protein
LRIKQGTNEVNLVRAETWGVKSAGIIGELFGNQRIPPKGLGTQTSSGCGSGKITIWPFAIMNPNESQGTNSGTLVEFKDAKDATVKSVILGKKQMKESQGGCLAGVGRIPGWRYILVPENPPHVWLVNETFASIETKPEQWLNKDFFKVEKVKSVSVTFLTNQRTIGPLHAKPRTVNGKWRMQRKVKSLRPPKLQVLTMLFPLRVLTTLLRRI